MDRDNRWERVKEAYDGVVNGVGTKTTDIIDTIKTITKQVLQMNFIKPIIVTNEDGSPKLKLKKVMLYFSLTTEQIEVEN